MVKKFGCLVVLLVMGLSIGAGASEKFAVDIGADLYSRYIWRGVDIGGYAPSIQPALTLSYTGFQFGVWGAFPLSNQASQFDEIDFWLGYTYEFENYASISTSLNDYYFPNAGIKMFNFNNYDAVDANGDPDPGAHTLEFGLSFTGPVHFPMTFSGYVNVYNDAGHNTYFQVDYPFAVGATGLTVFCGATGGSKENPSYYNTRDFTLINVGISAQRSMKITESYSLPLVVSFILNPNEEISYFVVGVKF